MSCTCSTHHAHADRLITAKEMAAHLSKSLRSVQRLAHRGAFGEGCFRVGREYRFDRTKAVQALLHTSPLEGGSRRGGQSKARPQDGSETTFWERMDAAADSYDDWNTV